MKRVRETGAVLLVVGMLLLAGCSAGTTPGNEVGSTQTTAAPGGSAGGDGGTVHFYISDEKNAIEDFAHLNVTITKVGFEKAGGEGKEQEEEETETETPRNGTATPANATATPAEDEENEGEQEGEAKQGDKGDGKAGWIEHQVDEQTVDLTKLQGANATQIGNVSLPEGNYTKVFVYVSAINATLKNGEQVRVKLPSQKLQIKKQFTVGNGEQVDFVFDISVFKAGNSGKYILKPVVSQSGTSDEVEVEKVDKQGKPEKNETEESDKQENEEKREEKSDTDESEDTGLSAAFIGDITPGENATLKVTSNGSAVANATVEVNDERAGTTDADGTTTIAVPEDVKKLKVKVKKGDAQAELVKKFEKGDKKGGDGNGENGK